MTEGDDDAKVGWASLRPEQQAVLRGVEVALREEHPLPLLELVSSVLTAWDPRTPDTLGDLDLSAYATSEELVEAFLDAELLPSSAFLAVVAATTGDEVLRSRVRRRLVARHDLPAWLGDFALEPRQVAEMTDVLGDGDDLFIGVRTSSRHEFTLLVYIDHNAGTIVKDAFAIQQPFDTVLEGLRTEVAGPDQDIHTYDAADARARIEAAVDKALATYPPPRSETWPACLGLVEWVLRRLPAGGEPDHRPHWPQYELRSLSDDFVASELGQDWDDPAALSLLGSLFRFATEDGSGDPMRWSPVVVEVVLADWIPRRLFADVDQLARVPDLLRAFIPYCHRHRGVRAELTARTTAAVDHCESSYQRAIRAPRDSGLLAVLDRVEALDRPAAHMSGEVLGRVGGHDTASLEEYMLASLTRAVGGMEPLDRLDDRALGDEAFDWEPVPADVKQRVAEVASLCDQFCDDVTDVEFRTACRRLLADVAAGDPEIFRRKGSAARAAATVCWLVGMANGRVGYDGELRAKDLLAWFGVRGGVSQSAEVMLRAVGVDPVAQFGIVDLGSPRYLTSARRAEIIRRRDHYRREIGD